MTSMSTREFRRIKLKFILLLLVFLLMMIWSRFLPGAIILFFMSISVIEILKKKELIITVKIQKLVVLFFELIAKLTISILYISIIIPMAKLASNLIKSELKSREIKESDKQLEGCVYDIVYERSY